MNRSDTQKSNGKPHRDTIVRRENARLNASAQGNERSFANRVVFLIGPDQIPRIMVNAMVARFGPTTVLVEDKEPTSIMVKRRARMLGWFEALGQVAFGVWLKALHKLSGKRKEEIFKDAKFVEELPSLCTVHHVPSVNSELCRNKLRALNPDLIVVIGTRMIKSATLRATDATVVNYHAGINPTYRGMNGGYFALANDEPDKFGVTIHLVDDGVDTGSIITQSTIQPKPSDNFTTYPLVLAMVGREALATAIEQVLAGELKTVDVGLPSKQWFHPTLWDYLWTGIRKGVW